MTKTRSKTLVPQYNRICIHNTNIGLILYKEDEKKLTLKQNSSPFYRQRIFNLAYNISF